MNEQAIGDLEVGMKVDRGELVKKLASPFRGTFVEIGTDSGSFAEFILTNTRCSTLYCIDPYTPYEDYHDAINNVTGDWLFAKTQKRLAVFGDRVKFVRQFSTLASIGFPHNIDLLYIDGNHRYSFVMDDLTVWYPKVKEGGIIVGDDAVDTDDSKRDSEGNVFIEWSPGCYGSYGCLKAFRDFCGARNISYRIYGTQVVIRKNRAISDESLIL